MCRRGFFLVLSWVFLCSFLVLPARPVMAAPQIEGQSAVLIDTHSGQVLYELHKDEQVPPASTTKILTAIIAIESGKLEETVTVGKNPPLVDGTKVYLEEGEKLKLRDLVLAALVHSANDAALAIAEYLNTSQEEFSVVMNEKAREIGAVHSSFVTPHGLHEENHYTTAYDLALISRYAMQNEVFREMVETKVLDWEGQAWQTRLINKNRLLWDYRDADGIKTGYTKEARNTISASATREGVAYIAVVMGSSATGIYKDAAALLDYGFENFEQVQLAAQGAPAAIMSVYGEQKLEVVAGEAFALSLPREGARKIESHLSLLTLQDRIQKGQEVGEMVFTVDGAEKGRIKLLANNDVAKPVDFTMLIISALAFLYCLQIAWRLLSVYLKKRRGSYGPSRYRRDYRNYNSNY